MQRTNHSKRTNHSNSRYSEKLRRIDRTLKTKSLHYHWSILTVDLTKEGVRRKNGSEIFHNGAELQDHWFKMHLFSAAFDALSALEALCDTALHKLTLKCTYGSCVRQIHPHSHHHRHKATLDRYIDDPAHRGTHRTHKFGSDLHHSTPKHFMWSDFQFPSYAPQKFSDGSLQTLGVPGFLLINLSLIDQYVSNFKTLTKKKCPLKCCIIWRKLSTGMPLW